MGSTKASTAGAVAKRNGWVELSSIEALPAAEILGARACTVVFAVIVCVMNVEANFGIQVSNTDIPWMVISVSSIARP